MNPRLQGLVEKFDAMPQRTRLIITFAFVAILFMMFELFWFAEQRNQLKRVNGQIKTQEQAIEALTQTQAEINAGVYDKRSDPKRQRLERIATDLDSVQQQLQLRTQTLIRPEAMAGLLEDIIENSQKLKLVSLTKQAPQPLFENGNETTPENDQESPQMYRHAVSLVFEGRYQDTQKFVEQLESMENKVNFDQFEFSVEEYPKSTVTLIVSTYSLTRKWIGG